MTNFLSKCLLRWVIVFLLTLLTHGTALGADCIELLSKINKPSSAFDRKDAVFDSLVWIDSQNKKEWLEASNSKRMKQYRLDIWDHNLKKDSKVKNCFISDEPVTLRLLQDTNGRLEEVASSKYDLIALFSSEKSKPYKSVIVKLHEKNLSKSPVYIEDSVLDGWIYKAGTSQTDKQHNYVRYRSFDNASNLMILCTDNCNISIPKALKAKEAVSKKSSSRIKPQKSEEKAEFLTKVSIGLPEPLRGFDVPCRVRFTVKFTEDDGTEKSLPYYSTVQEGNLSAIISNSYAMYPNGIPIDSITSLEIAPDPNVVKASCRFTAVGIDWEDKGKIGVNQKGEALIAQDVIRFVPMYSHKLLVVDEMGEAVNDVASIRDVCKDSVTVGAQCIDIKKEWIYVSKTSSDGSNGTVSIKLIVKKVKPITFSSIRYSLPQLSKIKPDNCALKLQLLRSDNKKLIDESDFYPGDTDPSSSVDNKLFSVALGDFSEYKKTPVPLNNLILRLITGKEEGSRCALEYGESVLNDNGEKYVDISLAYDNSELFNISKDGIIDINSNIVSLAPSVSDVIVLVNTHVGYEGEAININNGSKQLYPWGNGQIAKYASAFLQELHQEVSTLGKYSELHTYTSNSTGFNAPSTFSLTLEGVDGVNSLTSSIKTVRGDYYDETNKNQLNTVVKNISNETKIIVYGRSGVIGIPGKAITKKQLARLCDFSTAIKSQALNPELVSVISFASGGYSTGLVQGKLVDEESSILGKLGDMDIVNYRCAGNDKEIFHWVIFPDTELKGMNDLIRTDLIKKVIHKMMKSWQLGEDK